MEIFRSGRVYDFMGRSKLFIVFSLLLMLASYGILFTKGLNYGIDFSGGTIIQVKYPSAAPIDAMRSAIGKDADFAGASITEFGSPDEVVIRIPTSSTSVGKDVGDSIRGLLKDTGEFEIRRVDMVGPKVGSELREKGMMAMGLAILAILIYVAFRFEWRFAVASIFALVHDVSIALGAISLSKLM